MIFRTTGTQPPPRLFAGMELVDDSDVGRWVEAEIDHSGSGVRGFVPSGFDAYAVVFPPAFREVSRGEGSSLFAPEELRGDAEAYRVVHHREVRWSEVADANGRVAHPAMEWEAITGRWEYRRGGGQPGVWDVQPEQGGLPLRVMVDLCRRLAAHTRTPGECLFGVSMIYGNLPDFVREATQRPSTTLGRSLSPSRRREPDNRLATDARLRGTSFRRRARVRRRMRRAVAHLVARLGVFHAP